MYKSKKTSVIALAISAAFLLTGTSTFAEYSQEQNVIIDPNERNTSQQNKQNTSSSQGADHNKEQNKQIGSTSINSDRYAKKMMGMDVINSNDENIGELEDIALDSNGKAEYAIVSVGGFLGVGDKLIAVPYEELRMNQNDEKIVLDVTKDRLEQANEFQYKQ
jgi:sporulation protein YlmC with PRC-barrel domain